MRRLAPLLLVLAGACQTMPVSGATVEMSEFAIEPSSSHFGAGTIRLDVVNSGDYGHTLIVTDALGRVVSADDLLLPSQTTTLSLDLSPGEYRFTCRIVAQDDAGNVIDHFERGMVADVTVDSA